MRVFVLNYMMFNSNKTPLNFSFLKIRLKVFLCLSRILKLAYLTNNTAIYQNNRAQQTIQRR